MIVPVLLNIKEPQKQAFPGFLAKDPHIYLVIVFLMPDVMHPLLDNLIVSLILRLTISFSIQQVTMKSRISWLSFFRQTIFVY